MTRLHVARWRLGVGLGWTGLDLVGGQSLRGCLTSMAEDPAPTAADEEEEEKKNDGLGSFHASHARKSHKTCPLTWLETRRTRRRKKKCGQRRNFKLNSWLVAEAVSF